MNCELPTQANGLCLAASAGHVLVLLDLGLRSGRGLGFVSRAYGFGLGFRI